MRVLTPQDARAMAEIHAASFDKGWDALEMSAHLAKDVCFGTGDPLAAFIICARAADQADILTIATHPDARRQGLAQTLLQDAISALRDGGVRSVFLEVAEDNLAAQGLYRAVGFAAIGRRPAYYRRSDGRVAALTFSKELDVDGSAA